MHMATLKPLRTLGACLVLLSLHCPQLSNGAEDGETRTSQVHDPQRQHGHKGIRRRCALTIGGWCGHHQELVPGKPALRGDKPCPKNCSNVGTCNYDAGLCLCPAGWQGEDCSERFRRPCTDRWRDPTVEPLGHIDETGKDLNWLEGGWTASRCAGICDDDIGACFCQGEKYGRINRPKDAAPGTPPVQFGRYIGEHCGKPSTDAQGNHLQWGRETPHDFIYGPNGFCVADQPHFHCGCSLDGLTGHTCEERHEPYCPNSCSGHGECQLGFCKCHEGWYGTECARRRQGLPLEPAMAEHSRPWLTQTALPIPALAEAPPERKRPLIFIYDLPPEANTRMLQYRIEKTACVWRAYDSRNHSSIDNFQYIYAVEPYLHEVLISSEHRTFDPEEADFFYVPWYLSCFMHPIWGYADGPWWDAPNGVRVSHTAMLALKTKRHIQQHYPYWNRTGGADHIFLFTHDEGACWAPSEIFNHSIILTHWGRMDLPHASNTAYPADNYTDEHTHPSLQPHGWLRIIGCGEYENNTLSMCYERPCFEPKRGLIIPQFIAPSKLMASPLLGAPPQERTITCFFRGDMGQHRLPNYSRGIRMRVMAAYNAHDWATKHNFLIGDHGAGGRSYSELLATSKFCLVMPGDGWSGRAEYAVLHGCLPVVIMDNTLAVFENILDYTKFGVRVAEADVEKLPEILAAVDEATLRRMQQRIARVWHRFMYTQHPLVRERLQNLFQENLRHPRPDPEAEQRLLPPAEKELNLEDDAFGTIIQWLHARIPEVSRRARPVNLDDDQEEGPHPGDSAAAAAKDAAARPARADPVGGEFKPDPVAHPGGDGVPSEGTSAGEEVKSEVQGGGGGVKGGVQAAGGDEKSVAQAGPGGKVPVEEGEGGAEDGLDDADPPGESQGTGPRAKKGRGKARGKGGRPRRQRPRDEDI